MAVDESDVDSVLEEVSQLLTLWSDTEIRIGAIVVLSDRIRRLRARITALRADHEVTDPSIATGAGHEGRGDRAVIAGSLRVFPDVRVLALADDGDRHVFARFAITHGDVDAVVEVRIDPLALRIDADGCIRVIFALGDLHAAGECLRLLAVARDGHGDVEDVAGLDLGVAAEFSVECTVAVDCDGTVLAGAGGHGISGFEAGDRVRDCFSRLVDRHRRLVEGERGIDRGGVLGRFVRAFVRVG